MPPFIPEPSEPAPSSWAQAHQVEIDKAVAAVRTQVRCLRESKGISRREVSRRSGLALHTVMSVEDGEHSPSLYSLVSLLQALGGGLAVVDSSGQPTQPVQGDRRHTSGPAMEALRHVQS